MRGIIEPPAKALLRIGVSPDAVTVVGTVGASATALWFVPRGEFGIAIVLVAVFAISDLLDGTMARLRGSSGPWGNFLDATMDRLADGAVFGGLVLYGALNDEPWVTAGALLALLTGVLASAGATRTLAAQQPPVVPPAAAPACAPGVDVSLLVDEGTAAYGAHRYGRSAERFAAAVAACPEDTDLLLNWGTAAWAASDTVSAVIAWQRAARLEPLAVDVQERLALLPAGARGGVAEVPMVPVPALAIVAVCGWCLAWLLFWRAWRRPRGEGGTVTGMATVMLLASLAAGGAAWS